MRRTAFLALLLGICGVACAPALFTSTRADPVLYPEPSGDAITFWGHACAYIDIGGAGIITDPVFEPSYSVLHARRIPAPPPEAFDQTEIILVSHAHQDHLDPATLARFSPSATILCPEPSAGLASGLGPNLRAMRPGEVFAFSRGRITAVPAHHPGGRNSLKARPDGRALGFVIEAGGHTIYYSGDTEYFPGIDRIGLAFRPDIAILNVNAHLPPADALHAVLALGATKVIASHWGAYRGPNARRDGRWHEEFLALLGPAGIPLQVGECFPLKAREKGPQPLLARGSEAGGRGSRPIAAPAFVPVPP